MPPWQSPKNMYYVYSMSNSHKNVIYVGITNDLIRRVYEHKNNTIPESFTAKYSVHKLVYFESTSSRYEAISREKQIKSWNRKRKNKLVETMNPKWIELYDTLL